MDIIMLMKLCLDKNSLLMGSFLKLYFFICRDLNSDRLGQWHLDDQGEASQSEYHGSGVIVEVL